MKPNRADVRHARLLRRPVVCERTGLKTSTLYALMQLGDFPRPVKLTARTVAWPEAAVQDWIEKRLADADAA